MRYPVTVTALLFQDLLSPVISKCPVIDDAISERCKTYVADMLRPVSLMSSLSIHLVFTRIACFLWAITGEILKSLEGESIPDQ